MGERVILIFYSSSVLFIFLIAKHIFQNFLKFHLLFPVFATPSNSLLIGHLVPSTPFYDLPFIPLQG